MFTFSRWYPDISQDFGPFPSMAVGHECPHCTTYLQASAPRESMLLYYNTTDRVNSKWLPTENWPHIAWNSRVTTTPDSWIIAPALEAKVCRKQTKQPLHIKTIVFHIAIRHTYTDRERIDAPKWDIHWQIYIIRSSIINSWCLCSAWWSVLLWITIKATADGWYAPATSHHTVLLPQPNPWNVTEFPLNVW